MDVERASDVVSLEGESMWWDRLSDDLDEV
jgi:hypothetical protein